MNLSVKNINKYIYLFLCFEQIYYFYGKIAASRNKDKFDGSISIGFVFYSYFINVSRKK